ncbi:ECF RNA polymerase sigma-E factor [Stieleria neptunia]|uniref:ECF RNA polymerase sigma-E factor n=1 Tax=Stieleria neptunia TaxID=2527979 RepID=A0A518HN46_9BACT|nr:sigma-70 family RNA polymerase sigma factor [Stieleria neptunia]QDV42239.1 ECF RNA polymerase sigma-E factor [Stieleria neptunia]
MLFLAVVVNANRFYHSEDWFVVQQTSLEQLAPQPNVIEQLSGKESPETLVSRCRKGDRRAFDRLQQVSDAQLRRYLEKKSGARGSVDIDDVMQETWIKVLNNLNAFTHGSFMAWLYTVAWRTFLDAQKKRRPVQVSDDTLFEHYLRVDLPKHSDGAALDALESCVNSLDAGKVQFVKLLLAGMKADAIAIKLGLTNQQIYKRKHTLKAELFDCIMRRLNSE